MFHAIQKLDLFLTMEFAPFLIVYQQEKMDAKFVNKEDFGSNNNVSLQIIMMKLSVKYAQQIISLTLKTNVLKVSQDVYPIHKEFALVVPMLMYMTKQIKDVY